MSFLTIISTLVLYTIKDDHSPVAKDIFLEYLASKGFEKEGDQSTLMRKGFPPTNPLEFMGGINTLKDDPKFTEGDTITLITPLILTDKTTGLPTNSIMQRYKFRYDSFHKVFLPKEEENFKQS